MAKDRFHEINDAVKLSALLGNTLVKTVLILAVIFFIMSGVSYNIYHASIEEKKSAIGQELMAIARTAVPLIDAGEFERLFVPPAGQIRNEAEYMAFLKSAIRDSAFRDLQMALQKVISVNAIRHFTADNVYCFSIDALSPEDYVRWAVMTHATPFTGEKYKIRPEMKAVLAGKVFSTYSEVYLSEASHKEWMSAYVPIKGANGRVIGLLEVAWQIEEVLNETSRAVQQNLLLISGTIILGIIAAAAILSLMVKLQKVIQRLKAEIKNYNHSREALEQNEQKYQTLFNSIADPVFIFEKTSYRFLEFNAAALKMYGYSREELLQMTPFDLHPPEDDERVRKNIDSKNPERSNEYCHLRKDGSKMAVDILTDEMKYQGKAVWISIVRDITERKKTEDLLQKALRQAESANRAKGEFLANMSHEIRTPLNGILGMTELVLESRLTPEQREYLEIVYRSGESLLALLNDILDFSKIEAGKLEMEMIEFQLSDSLAETLRLMALRAHQKGLELVYQISPDIPERFIGDPTRLRQVLINLIGNAIKFTQKGEVFVNVEGQPKNGHRFELHFSVIDTGIGIPPEKQQKIFNMFSQVDGSSTRKYGGTGLGLSIASQLIAMMGGKIWVISPARHHARTGEAGSEFHFTVILEKSRKNAETVGMANVHEMVDLPVLVVDDNDTNRLILQKQLLGWGAKPVLAESAETALQVLAEYSERNQQFGLIILDQQMPHMDGFEFAQRLKANPVWKNISLLMLTSSNQRGDGKRCKKIGIDGYLPKPVKPDELLKAVLKILEVSKHPDIAPPLITRYHLQPQRPEKPGRKQSPQLLPRLLRILVAEDNLVNQKLVVRLLERVGAEVKVVNNGKEALQAWQENKFDLIFMDWQMPVMDGLEATQEIRRQEKETGVHIPIIALTAHAMTGDREKGLAAGMDDYITKPVKKQDLIAAIRKAGLLAATEDSP